MFGEIRGVGDRAVKEGMLCVSDGLEILWSAAEQGAWSDCPSTSSQPKEGSDDPENRCDLAVRIFFSVPPALNDSVDVYLH
jgi:hypothetical protein